MDRHVEAAMAALAAYPGVGPRFEAGLKDSGHAIRWQDDERGRLVISSNGHDLLVIDVRPWLRAGTH